MVKCCAVLLTLAVACFSAASPPDVWFDDIDNTAPAFGSEEGDAICEAVAVRLLKPEKSPPPWPKAAADDKHARIVFLTVSDGASRGRVVFGGGDNIREAALDAIERYRRGAEGKRRDRFVKLDIVALARAFEDPPMPGMLRQERSLIGIALDRDLQAAFLPEESYIDGLINGKQIIVPDNIVKAHNRRPIKAGRLSLEQVKATPFLYAYHTNAWFYNGYRAMPLYRGHRMFAPEALTNDLLLQSLRAGADYLRRSLNDDGSFDYLVSPTGATVPPDEYNVLRHCLAVYALYKLYGVTEDKRLLEAADAGLAWMLKRIKPWNDQGALVVLDELNNVKLGGQGVALLTLVEHARQTGDRSHLKTMQGLARYIVSLQQEDGSYKPHRQSFRTRKPDDWYVQFYDGEAMLGLIRLHSLDGDDRWIDSALTAAKYIMTVRDRNIRASELPRDHWLLLSLNELYPLRKEPIILAGAARYGDAIADAQNLNPIYPDWHGSFLQPPLSTNTATSSEGLLAAYALLRDHGGDSQPYREAATRMLRAAQWAVAFQMQTQFLPENSLYLDDPMKVLGSFRQSLTNLTVRIDFVQHNASALLQLYEIPEAQRQAVWKLTRDVPPEPAGKDD